MPADAPARRWAAGTPAASAREQDTAADKRLYVEVGMVPLVCRTCGTEVLVKKNSAKHTSVQWRTDPAASCPEFAGAVERGVLSAQYLGCPRLKASIADAAASGELVVPGD
jgi:hypothetical protein